MLHVLRHYLPFRKALLIVSETVLLTLIVGLGMSAHLNVDEVVGTTMRLLAQATPPWKLEDAIGQAWISAFMVSVLAQFAIAFNELYDFRVSSSRYTRAARFLGSTGWAILIVLASVTLMEIWGVGRILEFPGLPLAQTVILLTSTLILGFAVLYFWRALFHWLLQRARFNERLLIVGSGRLSERLVSALDGGSTAGFDLVGVYQPPGSARGDVKARKADTGNPWFEALRKAVGSESGEGAPARKLAIETPPKILPTALPLVQLPQGQTLSEFARQSNVDHIVVALSDRRGSLPTGDLLTCRLDGLTVSEGEAFFEAITGKIPAEAMRPSYLIFNTGFIQHPLTETMKRIVDIAASLAGLFFLWPAMLATAIAVRLDSPGPVLFKQERTGRSGRPFTLMKFRSMRVDAEKNTGPVWAQENDPRITRVGNFIRKTRLDELPQLINILGGSMSLVGPRPERPTFVADLSEKIPYFEQRHIVKPGMTGWAQINYPYGNTQEDALQKLQYDLFYIKYHSTLFDLSIIFNTIKTVILRKGT